MTDYVLATARNIVNQLGDFWEVNSKLRQNTNDMADQFTVAVLRTAMCATLAELLDEDKTPCRCNRCIQEKIDDLAIEGICPNCSHPMVWHEFKTMGQLESQYEVMTCKHCDCFIEKSH
jgi:hypothetical protein